MTDKAK